jgi:membrane dipeptidase
MLTKQNSTHFWEPSDVNTFFDLGQRISQLTYNLTNRIGSGFLTDFGRAIMKRMEEVGMGVDLSHCGDRTTLDALEAAKKPVLFTHATCRALVPGHLRAKTDEMIRKMAKTRGLIGNSFHQVRRARS